MTLVPLLLGLLVAAAERPSLTGVVKGPGNKPLSGAMVFIYTARPRNGTSTTCPSCYLDCRKRAETDFRGEFTIPALDPALLFRVGAMADGYQAALQADLDPAAGPITIRLSPQPPLPDSPRRVLRARVVGPDGELVVGVFVEPVGCEIDRANGDRDSTFGPIEVAATITSRSGRLALAVPAEVDWLFLRVEARGLASRTFRAPTGTQENELRLGVGRALDGRVVQDGRPVQGVVIGAAQVSTNSETFVGERTAETDTNGRFMLLNLPPDEPLVLYGKMQSLAGRGAIPERDIAPEHDGAVRDLGEVALASSVAVSGRVVLIDGKPIPVHTRISLDRLRAWDHVEVELGSNGSFRFPAVPHETVDLSIRVPGYELSTQNESLLPERSDHRLSLSGRLDEDTELRVLLEPVGTRQRAAPPRTHEEVAAFNARVAAVRARPLRAASSAQ